jgi:hypothetical protein
VTQVGTKVRVRCIKNKMAPPFRECELDVLFGSGVDTAGELLDAGVAAGVVARAGAWYRDSDSGAALGQGREAAARAIAGVAALSARIVAAMDPDAADSDAEAGPAGSSAVESSDAAQNSDGVEAAITDSDDTIPASDTDKDDDATDGSEPAGHPGPAKGKAKKA